VHVARYGGAADAHAPAVRAQLEDLMDALQPGWRERVAFTRFAPHLTVCHALATAERGGLPGRPPVEVGQVAGLFVAGDWVGPEGLLADASLASGYAAAQAILRRARSQDARGELLATA
jgi:phytoene dehydrogenase-like protein